jgi:hypothetical protein
MSHVEKRNKADDPLQPGAAKNEFLEVPLYNWPVDFSKNLDRRACMLRQSQPSRRIKSSLLMTAAVSLLAAQPRTDAVMSHVATGVPVLKAYLLTPQQEACFSRTDGQKTFFWNAWDQNAQLDRAVVQGKQDNLCWGPVPNNTDDCEISVKAAYGSRGVYLLFEVKDNVWLGFVDVIDYVNDAVEVYTEQHSSSDLYNNPTLFKAIDISQLTETYMQLQIRFGGTDPVQQFSYNYYNPASVGSPLTNPPIFVLYNRNITFDEAEQAYGLKVELLPVIAGSENIRKQEWLIPWGIWGGPNGTPLSTNPAPGTKLAFTFGYNDKDLVDEPLASAIRWKNAAEPYTTGTKSDGTTTTVDSWGDMEFTSSLNNAMAIYSSWDPNYTGCGQPASNPPRFTSTPPTTATEDVAYTYNLIAVDPDAGDVVSFDLVSGPAGMAVSYSMLSWVPTNAQVGLNPVTVRARDNHGAYVDQSFQISVANTNDAPVITSIAPTSATAGAQYRYQVVASDPDVGDVLTYSLEISPAGMTISSSGLITWTPAAQSANACRVRVADRAGAYVNQSFTIAVGPANHAPVISTVTLKAAAEDIPYRDTLHATDSDGNQVYWLKIAGSDSLSIDLNTGIISWTPRQTNVGNNTVRFRATDGVLSDTATYTLQVAFINDPPIIQTRLPDTVFTDSLYSIPLIAIDEEGAALQWAFIKKPVGTQFVAANLVWAPCLTRTSKDTIGITVSDGNSLDTLMAIVTVTARKVSVIRMRAFKIPARLTIESMGTGLMIGVPEQAGNGARLEVIAASGRIVQSLAFLKAGYFQIDLGKNVHGLHLVRITMGGETLIRRIFLP